MKDGFIRVVAATPRIKPADPAYNISQILSLTKRAKADGAQLLVLPELCVMGCTCGDLFMQDALLDAADAALMELVRESGELVIVAGHPLRRGGKLYNTAAVIWDGHILGFIPKRIPADRDGLSGGRHFAPAPKDMGTVPFMGGEVLFGTDILFRCAQMPRFTLGIAIGEDLWASGLPNVALSGAAVIANPSAHAEIVGGATKRRNQVAHQSERLICGYVFANAGDGESTTDMVFSGHNLIAENGGILFESKPFGEGYACSEIDLQALSHERRRVNDFAASESKHSLIYFSLAERELELTRTVDPHPFTPSDPAALAERCEEILEIQAHGLATRIEHAGLKTAVLGISGGLDSSLALLATQRAFKLLGRPLTDIQAVTMPCFGTTRRTKSAAFRLCESLGIPCREIELTESVRLHLKEIGHPEDLHDVTYENAQARFRTLVLMDIANQTAGLVVGTGDLSELALGWATYNGDHMSMYGVNAGVPKTLVRHIVQYAASTDEKLRDALNEILSMPVSPELLPPSGGEISQRTEELIGPYELHDFFLFHLLRRGRPPALIERLARAAFSGAYDHDTIRRWLKIFIRRFFTQQFKRSCLPDGPKIGSVSLSPRGGWQMPSDASARAWLAWAEEDGAV